MPNHRLSEDEAKRRLNAAGFEALEPYPGSGANWLARCRKCGNESARTLRSAEHHGCKWCVKNIVPVEEAEALLAANGLTPLEPFPGVSYPWHVQCKTCGKESTTRYRRLREQRGCVYCVARRKLDPADAIAQARSIGLEPLEPFPGTRNKWRLICMTCESIWVKGWGQVREGYGCAACSGAYVSPEQADEDFLTAGFTPQSPYISARNLRLVTCNECGHQLRVSREQALGGRQCPYCSGRRAHPDEAVKELQEAGFTPREPFHSIDAIWVAECNTCHKTVGTRLRSIRRGAGCIYCAQRKVDAEDAIAIMREAGLEPLEPYPGGRAPWLSQCNQCGKTVSPTLTRIKSGGARGCAYCSNRRLDAEDAVAIARAVGLEPLEPYRSTHTPWLCKCLNCGKEPSPQLTSLQRGSGCKYCAPYGLDLTKPATLYIISHNELRALKVGIAQHDSTRLNIHTRYGWAIEWTHQLPTGMDATRHEQALLKWLREELEVDPFLTEEDMPQGGWTETASTDEVTVKDLIKKAKAIVKE